MPKKTTKDVYQPFSHPETMGMAEGMKEAAQASAPVSGSTAPDTAAVPVPAEKVAPPSPPAPPPAPMVAPTFAPSYIKFDPPANLRADRTQKVTAVLAGNCRHLMVALGRLRRQALMNAITTVGVAEQLEAIITQLNRTADNIEAVAKDGEAVLPEVTPFS